MAKFMTGHRQMPSKIKPRLFISRLNRTNDRGKLDIETEEKLTGPLFLWSNEMDIESVKVF